MAIAALIHANCKMGLQWIGLFLVLVPLAHCSILPTFLSGLRRAGPTGVQQLQPADATLRSQPSFCHGLECPSFAVSLTALAS